MEANVEVERFNFDLIGSVCQYIVIGGFFVWCETAERFSNWRESKDELKELEGLIDNPPKYQSARIGQTGIIPRWLVTATSRVDEVITLTGDWFKERLSR